MRGVQRRCDPSARSHRERRPNACMSACIGTCALWPTRACAAKVAARRYNPRISSMKPSSSWTRPRLPGRTAGFSLQQRRRPRGGYWRGGICGSAACGRRAIAWARSAAPPVKLEVDHKILPNNAAGFDVAVVRPTIKPYATISTIATRWIGIVLRFVRVSHELNATALWLNCGQEGSE